MIEFLTQPWPWYFGGTMIAIVLFLLLWTGKSFGMSSGLRTVCSMMGAGKKVSFFQYDWKKEIWNIFFVIGVLIGGIIAGNFMQDPQQVVVAEQTQEVLKEAGVTDFGGLLPTDIFSWESLGTLRGFIFIVIGGFMVGFGTRYAGGCTSGHAIMGLSSLQWPSLVATVMFMVGGIIMTWFILPFLLTL
mgnify:CR=1 FL=1